MLCHTSYFGINGETALRSKVHCMLFIVISCWHFSLQRTKSSLDCAYHAFNIVWASVISFMCVLVWLNEMNDRIFPNWIIELSRLEILAESDEFFRWFTSSADSTNFHLIKLIRPALCFSSWRMNNHTRTVPHFFPAIDWITSQL